jgi:hypothetical protein
MQTVNVRNCEKGRETKHGVSDGKRNKRQSGKMVMHGQHTAQDIEAWMPNSSMERTQSFALEGRICETTAAQDRAVNVKRYVTEIMETADDSEGRMYTNKKAAEVQLTTTCEHNSSKRAGVKETNK